MDKPSIQKTCMVVSGKTARIFAAIATLLGRGD